MSEQASREAGGKIYTFGSYRSVPHPPSLASTPTKEGKKVHFPGAFACPFAGDGV
jgi:hypothetical protein